MNPSGSIGDCGVPPVLFESSRVGWTVVTVVIGFVLGWWDVSYRFEDASVVEPVDPFQGCVLDVVESFPGSSSSDDFGPVEAVDRFSHRVIERIADGSDRWFNAGLGEVLGVPDRQILLRFKGSSQHCLVGGSVGVR